MKLLDFANPERGDARLVRIAAVAAVRRLLPLPLAVAVVVLGALVVAGLLGGLVIDPRRHHPRRTFAGDVAALCRLVGQHAVAVDRHLASA